MTLVSIIPELGSQNGKIYRAVSAKAQSTGRTAGEALDALTAQLGEDETGTVLVVQNLRPDRYFNAAQCQRLDELMSRWRALRDAGQKLSAAEEAELSELVDTEVKAAGLRAEALARGLAS